MRTCICVAYDIIRPGSHISPMIGDSLLLIIQAEKSQRIITHE